MLGGLSESYGGIWASWVIGDLDSSTGCETASWGSVRLGSPLSKARPERDGQGGSSLPGNSMISLLLEVARAKLRSGIWGGTGGAVLARPPRLGPCHFSYPSWIGRPEVPWEGCSAQRSALYRNHCHSSESPAWSCHHPTLTPE